MQFVHETLDEAGRQRLRNMLASSFPNFTYASAPIALADEMYRATLQEKQRAPVVAAETYLRVGQNISRKFRDILRIAAKPPEEIRLFLDFASGYGRNLRFIRHWLTGAECHACDIDPAAVEFCRTHLGARGINSTLYAEDFACEQRFDAILVVSLFTHLKPPVFDAWVARLIGLLAEGGVLVLTARWHGAPRGPLPWTEVVPGQFCFVEISEAAGRLASDYYGGSRVSHDYMRALIERSGGRLTALLPHKISDHDVYVIARA